MNKAHHHLKMLLLLIIFILISPQLHMIKFHNISSLCRSSCDLFSEGMRNDGTSNDCEYISRNEFVSIVARNSSILEIGPFFNPSLGGPGVKYFDILDRAGLIKKAALSNDASNMSNVVVNTDTIPEIDYVSPKGDISIITERFSAVFSSHNIEHQVDLIDHLNQVANLLKDNGRFYLLIPDKRYCFDHFIAETPMSEVLATHFSGAVTHNMAAVLSMRCEVTHNYPRHHWQGVHGHMVGRNNLNSYLEAVKEFKDADGAYIDAHKWRFTPTSFEWIVNSLYEMKLIPIKIEKLYNTATGSNEFAAILSRP